MVNKTKRIETPVTIGELATEMGKERTTVWRMVQRCLRDSPPDPTAPWAWREGRVWKINRSAFLRANKRFTYFASPDVLSMQFEEVSERMGGTQTLFDRLLGDVRAMRAEHRALYERLIERDKVRGLELSKLRKELRELRRSIRGRRTASK